MGRIQDLQVGDLVLEPLEARHADEIFEVLRDPELYRHIDERAPQSVAQLRERYARLETCASPDGAEHWLNWVVRHGGLAIGYVQATVTPRRDAWIAFVFGQAYQGRGFASRSTRGMMECLARDFAVERFLASVEEANAPSIRLLERLGFAPASAGESKDRSPTERLYVLFRSATQA